MNSYKYVECTQTGRYSVLKELGTTSFSVYMAILSYRNFDSNVCNPSVNKIHNDFNIAVNTIRDNIDKLYDNGYLNIDSEHKNKSNNYFFPREPWYEDWSKDLLQSSAKRRKKQ